MLHRIPAVLVFALSILASCASETSVTSEKFPVVIVIHGGAGNFTRNSLDKESEERYRLEMQNALDAGYAILESGGSSLDAVEAAVILLEDSPVFNAGRGSVQNAAGQIEMDASIMEGREWKAGAVGSVSTVKNPVKAARAVMEQTKHVFLAGSSADTFARNAGLEIHPQSYFTDGRTGFKEVNGPLWGTVGAVAIDQQGNLASATSTGGLSGKMPGRIGDSPVIGAGTYADNQSCAVSCTGQGEYFIRLAVAKEISALVQHKGYALQQACDEVVKKQLKLLNGSGGVIAVDAGGNIAFSFNTTAMIRGWKKGETSEVKFFQ